MQQADCNFIFFLNRQINHFITIITQYMKRKISDYQKTRKLGSGSFGQITEIQINENGQKILYAMKTISQKQIMKLNKMHQPFIEKEILLKFQKISPEGFLGLHETHTDSENIYMILELCDGGCLQKLIPKLRLIPNKNQVVKKIIVKLVLTLQVMHKHGVVHRDLKPSNLLFKKDGTMKLADFGTAYAPLKFFDEQAAKQIAGMKQISQKKKNSKMNQEDLQAQINTEIRRATFVGTPLYMAPQLLCQDHCGPQADLWALGCIIYELIHSKTPFHDQNQGMVWKKIMTSDYSTPIMQTKNSEKSEFEYQCQFLVSALLVKQRSKRLGFGENGYQQLKSHSFFKGVDWQKIQKQPIQELAQFFEEEEMMKSIQSTQSKQSEEDKILLSGVIDKKMFFGNYKERMLVLNSTPKMIYYDTETGQKKGEIILKKDTPIAMQGNKVFTVTNQKKTFYFKSPKATQWVQMIKYAIVNAFY